MAAATAESKQSRLDFRQTRQSARRDNIKKEEETPVTEQITATAAATDIEAQRELDVLRQFDLNITYGPCIGVSRLERWERAKSFGLKPPREVYKIVKRHSQDERYTECIWKDEKGLVP